MYALLTFPGSKLLISELTQRYCGASLWKSVVLVSRSGFLDKMEEDERQPRHGHITSLSVLRTHRKRGIATALMRRSQQEMMDVFSAEYVSLHVRKSNKAAFHLYSVTLAYKVNDVEKGYYADGEDAYDMRCYFRGREPAGQDGTFVANDGGIDTHGQTTASDQEATESTSPENNSPTA
jgi:GNAT superfamily N-acetyltransferase